MSISTELIRRTGDRTRLFANAGGYLDDYLMSDYVERFGGVILSGNYGNHGVYADQKPMYRRMVQMMIFFMDHLCDTPKYADRH
jgi:hypothetical protein